MAQGTYRIGGLPSLNVNKKLRNNWSLNSKIESRLLFYRGEINGITEKDFGYLLTDISLIAAKKVGLRTRIAAGYLIRLNKDGIYHRMIQQFVVLQKFSGFRLAHRLLCDQTFSAREAPEFRFRYRITSEIPLNGLAVDPGEYYLKINNEYINKVQEKAYDLEIRLVPIIGHEISNRLKIEAGPDYRVNSFLNKNTKHSCWLTFSLFAEI